MGHKNIKPQQQQPVVRTTTAKAIAGLTEENLTGSSDRQGAIAAGAVGTGDGVVHLCICSFDGDDAE